MADLVAARSWLTIYQLPPHAHELNPVEPVWSHLKRSLSWVYSDEIGNPDSVGPTGRNKSLRGPASAQAGFPAASGDG